MSLTIRRARPGEAGLVLSFVREHAVDRILQIPRRGPYGRVDRLSDRRSGADGAGARRTLMEIVMVAAVAENGVIGSRGTIPWRLKSDLARLKAITLAKPVVMGR